MKYLKSQKDQFAEEKLIDSKTLFTKALKTMVNVTIYLSLECYIISVVQALFMTKNLQAILTKASIKRATPAIYYLSKIFDKLSGNRKDLVEIDDLK